MHKAFDGDLDPTKRYIFGYLPHGLYPAGAGYVSHLPSWRRAFPGVAPRVLCANIMHYAPIIRDLGAWLGFRQVTRQAFARALQDGGHVLMCPGGQRELLYATEARPGPRPVVRICVHHRGFCRLAAEHGAALLPVLCFGELLQLQNAVTWSWLQRRSYKLIGASLFRQDALACCSTRMWDVLMSRAACRCHRVSRGTVCQLCPSDVRLLRQRHHAFARSSHNVVRVTTHLSRAGFPLPYLLLGFWGMPLPKRTPAAFVVGPPVHPAPRGAGEAVTGEMVADLHRRFYESVRTLWDEHRQRHTGYEHHVLEFDGEL